MPLSKARMKARKRTDRSNLVKPELVIPSGAGSITLASELVKPKQARKLHDVGLTMADVKPNELVMDGVIYPVQPKVRVLVNGT